MHRWLALKDIEVRIWTIRAFPSLFSIGLIAGTIIDYHRLKTVIAIVLVVITISIWFLTQRTLRETQLSLEKMEKTEK